MYNKFLNKVYDQIVSETRIIGGKIHTPFSPTSFSSYLYYHLIFPSSNSPFSKHCKDVYSLNEQEIDYVWNEYKKGVTALINDKELSHQEKG